MRFNRVKPLHTIIMVETIYLLKNQMNMENIVVMEREQIISILKINEKKIQSYGIKSLAIFGSVARNEATANSDVDILVEFIDKPTFDRYMELKFYLEDCLGTKVDLVTHKMLKSQIRQTVQKEAIYVS